MQDIEQLPLKVWAEQLAHARTAAGLDINTLARELLLSASQIRGIEAGTLTAFHGPGYYLRAVEKLANRLRVALDPPITEMELTDSQFALKRVKSNPSAAPLAKRHSNMIGADTMPGSHRRSRVAVWMMGFIVVLVATGVWLATKEGWPSKEVTPSLTTNTPALTENTPSTVLTVEQDRIAGLALSAPSSAQELEVVHSPVQETQPNLAENSAPDMASMAPSTLPEDQSTMGLAPEQTPSLATVEQAPEMTAAPVPVEDMIEATFTADCWVEIRFTDGRLEQVIYKPGESFSVLVNDVDRLTFGNAQAVQATRAGQAFDLLGFTRAGNNVARISAQNLGQN